MPLLTEFRFLEAGQEIRKLLGARSLILASSSPRRQQILNEIGLKFKILSPALEENLNGSAPEVHVTKYSLFKARAVAGQISAGIILAADTVVVLGNEVMGKPGNKEEASLMLSKLSGQTHTVYTGVALINSESEREATGYQTTRVTFNQLSKAQIEEYLSSSEYQDKAGAYGIQGMGSFLVKEIKGDLDNVIGLPLATVLRLLAEVS